jgi:hypothetical protein
VQVFRHGRYSERAAQSTEPAALNDAICVPSQRSKILSYYAPAWLSIARTVVCKGRKVSANLEGRLGPRLMIMIVMIIIIPILVLTATLWIWSDTAYCSYLLTMLMEHGKFMA